METTHKRTLVRIKALTLTVLNPFSAWKTPIPITLGLLYGALVPLPLPLLAVGCALVAAGTEHET